MTNLTKVTFIITEALLCIAAFSNLFLLGDLKLYFVIFFALMAFLFAMIFISFLGEDIINTIKAAKQPDVDHH